MDKEYRETDVKNKQVEIEIDKDKLSYHAPIDFQGGFDRSKLNDELNWIRFRLSRGESASVRIHRVVLGPEMVVYYIAIDANVGSYSQSLDSV